MIDRSKIDSDILARIRNMIEWIDHDLQQPRKAYELDELFKDFEEEIHRLSVKREDDDSA